MWLQRSKKQYKNCPNKCGGQVEIEDRENQPILC